MVWGCVCVLDSLAVVVNGAPTSQWPAPMLRFQWLCYVAHSVLVEGFFFVFYLAWFSF